jgi:hypothetical protein
MQSGSVRLSALNSFPERSLGQSTLRIFDINLDSERMTGYTSLTQIPASFGRIWVEDSA